MSPGRGAPALYQAKADPFLSEMAAFATTPLKNDPALIHFRETHYAERHWFFMQSLWAPF